MDMNAPSNSSMTMNQSNPMMMMMTLHFGATDYLLFEAWRPSSPGAIAGACIGLFVFCILERLLAACRRSQELRWKASALLDLRSTRGLLSSPDEESSKEEVFRVSASSARPHPRLLPPFTPSRDIPRGLIQAIQSTFSYAMMLIVMTFNGAYIISIIVGLGVGEVLFGRMGRY